MHTSRRSQITTFIGIACLALLAFINGDSVGILAQIPHPLQFALFYAGLALTVWGFISGRGGFAGYFDGDLRWSKREVGILAGITIFALILRLWSLETSIHIMVDELNPATEVVGLWMNPALKILQPMGIFSPFPRLYASWEAMTAVFTGRTLTSLRFPSVVLGTLTIPAIYFLGRTLFNLRTAIIAALLLAAFPPHIHFSRLALLSTGDPLFGTLALAFFARGLRLNHRADWVLGGAALGLTQYFYEGGRLLFPALVIIWLTVYLLRHRANFVRWRRGLLAAGMVTLLIALPVYYTLTQMHGAAALRMNYMALTPTFWATLLVSPPGSPLFDFFAHNVINPFLMFVSKPEIGPYYAGDTPLVLAYLLPALLLGIVAGLRTAGGGLLILWLLGVWFGNLLLVDSAISARYLVVFPSIALVMALGIDWIAARLPVNLSRWVLAAYVTLCVVGQVMYYFGSHLETFNRQFRGAIDTEDALFRAANLPSGTQVILLGSHPDRTEDYLRLMLRYLADDVHLTLLPSLDGFDFARLSNQPVAFFIPPGDLESVQRLAAHFTSLIPQYTPYDIPRHLTYTLYVFPAPD